MCYTCRRMVARTSWCELCRFDDLLQARAVTTSIAAMEFDVRLCAVGSPARSDPDTHPGRPPFIVQVDITDVRDLAEVLDEIIEEQREFDRMLTQRSRVARTAPILTVITLTGAAEAVLILALLDW